MKIKKTFALFFFLILTSINFAFSQEIKVKSFLKKESDLFARLNERLDNNDNACAAIKIFTTGKDIHFSGMVVGNTIQEPGMIIVYLAEGASKITIKHADFGVLTYDFPEKVKTQTVYHMKLQLIKSSRNKTRSLFIPTLSLGSSHESYGIMIGLVKKGGGYIRVKWDLNNFKTAQDVGSTGNNNSVPWYTGEEKKQRMAITAGYIQRLAPPIYLYFGAGYGTRVLAWETIDGEFAKQTDYSFEGVEAEIGMILRMGPIAISGGVQSNSFKYLEANLGLGFMF